VPLGYEIQHLVVRVFGPGLLSARLPSELFGVAGLAALMWLAREVRSRGRMFAAILWSFLPILLRYAAEARPYSLALALSVISTALLFRIVREPRASWTILYGLCVLAGLCTQPYSVFLQIGLLAPLLFERRPPAQFRALAPGVCALSAALLAFAPWVVWSGRYWSQYASRLHEDFQFTPKLPLVFFREISGGSYVCSAVLFIFVVTGCLSRRISPLVKRQLLSGIGACVLLALAGDSMFHYFFAARQVLFTLVPMCVLAGEGWAEMQGSVQRPYVKATLAAVFLIAAGVKSWRYFDDHSENWGAASQHLLLATRSSCILYPSSDLPEVYEYFEPGLQARRCAQGRYTPTVILAVTNYSAPVKTREASEALAANGYSVEGIDRLGKHIEIRRYRAAKPVQRAGS
jgi:uncharacterized membrane protein